MADGLGTQVVFGTYRLRRGFYIGLHPDSLAANLITLWSVFVGILLF